MKRRWERIYLDPELRRERATRDMLHLLIVTVAVMAGYVLGALR